MGDADETLLGETGPKTGPDRVTEANPHLHRGDLVSRYVILEAIGRGAMGVVYAAIDPDLERRVALKLLHREQGRLVKEARALAKLSHPNVVAVHDVGSHQARLFIAMQYVEGASLDRWLDDGERSWQDVVDVFIQAGRGLLAAHGAGVIHRDFKPANVMVSNEGAVKVTDFGLARGGDESSVSQDNSIVPRSPLQSAADVAVTQASAGTPAYMSPELLQGDHASAASDQFAFCVSLHRALHGEFPFDGEDVPSLMAAIIDHRLRPLPPRTRVPRTLQRIIERGIAPTPAERFSSMSEVVAALQRARAPSRRKVAVAAVLGVTGLAAWGMASSQTPDPCAHLGDEIAAAWNQKRATELAAAFRRSALPYAERSAQEATTTLDEYAQQWLSLADQTCRARHESPEEERTLLAHHRTTTCLQRARDELEAVADVMAKGDGDVITMAPELVHGLPRLDDCTDPTLAMAFPVPDDPERQAEAARIRAKLAHVRASRLADSRVDPRTLDEVANRAAELEFLPLQAEVALEQAKWSATEQLEADAYEAALRLGIEADHDVAVALATAELLGFDGDGRGRVQRATAWEQVARGFIRRWSDRTEATYELNNSLGNALSSRGLHDEALHFNQRATEVARRSGDRVKELRARGNRALLLRRAGRVREALDFLKEYREEVVEFYGPEHPQTAWTWDILGTAYFEAGDLDQSIVAHERAIRLYENSDYSRVTIAKVQLNLAGTLAMHGQATRAYELAKDAARTLQEELEGDHLALAAAFNSAGVAANRLEKTDEALEWFSRSLVMNQRLGESARSQIPAAVNVADAHAELGNDAQAREAVAYALELAKTLPSDDPMLGRAEQVIGEILVALDDPTAALPHLLRAEASLSKSLDAESQELKELRDKLQEVRDSQ